MTPCTRAILAPHDVIVDRRELDYCIERLRRALWVVNGYTKVQITGRYPIQVGVFRAHVPAVLQELKRMRDRARERQG